MESSLSKGSLLIAAPGIQSGLYYRSVVLLCEHNQGGSFGLVINKPFEIELPPEILDIPSAKNPHLDTRAGGPLQIGQMMLLHSSNSIPDQVLQICPDLFLGGNLEFLQQAAMNPEGPNIRLCFGYSGWAAKQLETEVLRGDWFLHRAQPKHVFEIPPELLWKSILLEMGGKYAPLSMIPEDLSLN